MIQNMSTSKRMKLKKNEIMETDKKIALQRK